MTKAHLMLPQIITWNTPKIQQTEAETELETFMDYACKPMFAFPAIIRTKLSDSISSYPIEGDQIFDSVLFLKYLKQNDAHLFR